MSIREWCNYLFNFLPSTYAHICAYIYSYMCCSRDYGEPNDKRSIRRQNAKKAEERPIRLALAKQSRALRSACSLAPQLTARHQKGLDASSAPVLGEDRSFFWHPHSCFDCCFCQTQGNLIWKIAMLISFIFTSVKKITLFIRIFDKCSQITFT